MHARPRAVAGLESADHLAGDHNLAFRDERCDGLDGRKHLTRANRDDGSVDDDSGEVHNPTRDGKNLGAVGDRSEIDSAVANAVGRGRREEGSLDDARPVDGPHPGRVGGGNGSTDSNVQQQGKGGKTHAVSMPRSRASVVESRPGEKNATTRKGSGGAVICWATQSCVSRLTSRVHFVAHIPISLAGPEKSGAPPCGSGPAPGTRAPPVGRGDN